MPLSKLIVCFPKIVKAPYTTVKNLYKGIIFLGIVVEVFSCTEYSFRTRKACFLHRMPQKTLRVPQEAVLRTECQFRTVGGRFRYRMHILYTPNPLYRVRGGNLCISLQKLRVDISGDNTGNNQLYPQGVGGSEMWHKTKMPQSEL